MNGLKVKCTNCGRTDFVTTDKYDPNVAPNGSMVRCLLPYHIDWLTTSTTLASEMTCPECLAQLAPSGKLTVLPEVPARDDGDYQPGEPIEPNVGKPAFVCDICGREVKTAAALTRHKQSHNKGE